MATPATPTTTASAPASASTDAATLSHVQSYWATIRAKSPIYAFLFDAIRIEHAARGVVRATLPLTAVHVNSKGGLHGSVSATLVDWAGGLAITAWDNRAKNGVSVDMHLSFVSSAREGDVVEVEGRADKVGGTLAFTTVVVRKVVEGKEREEWPVVAQGSHTKFVKM
ncbi:HotDog domain-containing protein [Phyllosticta citricarpa]|uniref:HotDog domain-containing protein n=2 Tax=Phyllosticta TaxID=121621 RepID=A0ABR1MKN8_9PEZI